MIGRFMKSGVARGLFVLFVLCALVPLAVLALLSLTQVSSLLLHQGEAGGQYRGEGEKPPAERVAEHVAQDARGHRDPRAEGEPDRQVPRPHVAHL